MDIEKQAVGYFRIIFVLKKADLWRFLQRISNQTTLSLGAMYYMTDTANNSDFDTDTPLPLDTTAS